MGPRIKIPTPLRRLTGGESEVRVPGETVRALVGGLEERFPGFSERLCEENGDLRRFVNVYVNGEDVRFLSGLETTVTEQDEVSIVPAVAGGQ